MIAKLISNVKEIDKSIVKVMIRGFKFSAYICIFSLLILLTYSTYPISHILLDSSLIIFRTGLFFAVGFFMCGFVVDKLKKQMN